MAALSRFTADQLHNRGIDLYDELPPELVAILTDISEARIRQWKRRGHLTPAGVDERGRPTYRGIDVLRAEAKISKRQGLRHAAPAPCLDSA